MKRFCLIASLVALAGCATHWDRPAHDHVELEQADVELASHFDEDAPEPRALPEGDSRDVSEGLTLPGPPLPADDNGSMRETLQEAWSVAMSIDPELEASQWQASASQRGLYAAQAERLPSASARASYAVFDNPLTYVGSVPTTPPTSVGITINQREFFMGQVRATQPLYTFGRISNAIDSAGAEVTAAVANVQRTELDVRLQVAADYIGVLKMQRLVAIAEANVTSLEGHERDVKNQVEAGVGIRANLLAVQVALANAQQFRLQMQNLLTVAKSAYNRALQRPLETPVQIEDLSRPTQEYDLDTSTQQALGTRPEIEFLSAKVQALRSSANSVHASNLPQIQVEGGFRFIESRFLADEAYNDVTVMADWNFWDSGRKRHRTAQLEQAAEGLLRQRSQVESLIALQVKSAWHDLDSNQERVRVNQQSLESADENLRVSRNRYKAGAGTNTEVLDAQKLRTNAYSSYYTSLYDAILSEMQLRRAIGEL